MNNNNRANASTGPRADVSVTLYRIEVKHPPGAIWMRPEQRGVWVRPNFGARSVFYKLSHAKAALTRYRNRCEHSVSPPQYRIVAITGDWTEVDL